jgi:hypothetical protein
MFQSGQMEIGPGSFKVPKGIFGFGFHPETEKRKGTSPAEKVARSRELFARTEEEVARSVSRIRRVIPLGAMNVPDISEAREKHRTNFVGFLNEEIDRSILGGVSDKNEKGGLINFLTALEKIEMFGACTDVRIEKTGIGNSEFKKVFSDFIQWRGQNEASSIRTVRGTEADFKQVGDLYEKISSPNKPEKDEEDLATTIWELRKELSLGTKKNWDSIKELEFSKIERPEILQVLTDIYGRYRKILGDNANPQEG